ncbi:MAG: CPBP family intramembrane metalloprotease [Lachnospiraceae bacterium]|nr:CPBP family intramembrane metalloprotease [Lachnospiraceae bacterium]
MESKKSMSIKNIINIFLPLFFAMLIQIIVVVGDIVAIFIKNMLSDKRTNANNTIEYILSKDYTQPMNMAALSFIQYAMYILIFGIWYYKTKKPSIKEGFFSIIKPPVIIPLIIAGMAAQVLVDSILALIRPIFETSFNEYDKLISNVTGASASWLMYLSVFLLAPIAEEILFRGLILSYGKKCMPIYAAVILQAFLFGLYHGNIIQGTYAFILGTLLGYIASKTGTLFAGICFHIALNTSIAFVPAVLFESDFSCIISGAISFIILIIGIVVMNYMYKKKADKVNQADYAISKEDNTED